MLNEGQLPGFRVGTKLCRTDPDCVDEYVREGQYARYRHELRRLRARSAQRSVAKALAQANQKIDGVPTWSGRWRILNRAVVVRLGLRERVAA